MSKNPVRVVVIGGGSGLGVVLRGLKHLTDEITAIVTVADDGGSSGVLRADMGMLPPGDIRSCIVALSNREGIMEELMQYRFKEGKLKGQSLGNLIIAGLTDMKGSMEEALRHIHDIFAVTGRVLPVSNEDIVLYAKLANGLIVKGESKIPQMVTKYHAPIQRVFIEPSYAKALPESLQAIRDADIIMIGPGSLYTSILPNLLIEDLQAAVANSRAKKVLAMNLMTQPGETQGMCAFDHIETLLNHTRLDLIDSVLINDGQVSDAVEERYQRDGATLLRLSETEERRLETMGIEVIRDTFIEVKQGYIRHDAAKLSEMLLNLLDTKPYVSPRLK